MVKTALAFNSHIMGDVRMLQAGTTAPRALAKSLALLARIIENESGSSLSAIAAVAGIPLSTAHRLVTGFEETGFLMRIGRGRYVAGPALTRLADLRRDQDWGAFAARVSRPILNRVFRKTGRPTHLGVLEDNMMTYLVKAGDRQGHAISREGMQLEAYCSGIGKALLAHLPPLQLEAYLASEPFVRLTPTTITSAAELRRELVEIRKRGYAVDNGEMAPGLVCLAVPIKNPQSVSAAISLVATHEGAQCDPTDYLPLLQDTAQEIEKKLFPYLAAALSPPDNQSRRSA